MTVHQMFAWGRPRRVAMGDPPFECTWTQQHGYHEFQMCLVVEPWMDAIVWRVSAGILRGKLRGGTPRPVAEWTNMQRKIAEYVCEEHLEGVGRDEIIPTSEELTLTLRKKLTPAEASQLEARYQKVATL